MFREIVREFTSETGDEDEKVLHFLLLRVSNVLYWVCREKMRKIWCLSVTLLEYLSDLQLFLEFYYVKLFSLI